MRPLILAISAALVLGLAACAAKPAQDAGGPQVAAGPAPSSGEAGGKPPVDPPKPPPRPDAPRVDTAVTPAERAECAQRGGSLQQGGLLGIFRCVIPYADAGKPCTDGDQCEGACWSNGAAPGKPAEGRCQPTNMPFGCHANVTRGEAGPVMCVD